MFAIVETIDILSTLTTNQGDITMDYEEAIDKQTRITESHAIAIMKNHGVIEEDWEEGLNECRVKSSGSFSSRELLFWLGY